jgi:methionyl-tRNA formyltransferase
MNSGAVVKPARVIVITGDGLEHHYVTNQLAAALPLVGIVVDHGKPVSKAEKIRRYFRRYTVLQLLSRVWLALLRRFWKAAENRRQGMLSVFGPDNCLEFRHPELLHHVQGINTPEGVRVVASLEPDVILVYGTGIVGGKVLSLARTIALNMHTGISPYYRGCDCAFWPLHNEELHMLGATVHECVKDVDGGQIFGTTGIRLHADDDIGTVFARCVDAGARLYAQKAQELLQRCLEGAKQDLSLGSEYMAVMRDARAERKVRNAIRSGMIRRYLQSRREEQHADPIPAVE